MPEALNEIQRYGWRVSMEELDSPQFVQDPSGGYVRFSDVQVLVERLEAETFGAAMIRKSEEIKRLEARIEELSSLLPVTGEEEKGSKSGDEGASAPDLVSRKDNPGAKAAVAAYFISLLANDCAEWEERSPNDIKAEVLRCFDQGDRS